MIKIPYILVVKGNQRFTETEIIPNVFLQILLKPAVLEIVKREFCILGLIIHTVQFLELEDMGSVLDVNHYENAQGQKA